MTETRLRGSSSTSLDSSPVQSGSNLGRFLIVDVTALMGSSMSFLGAFFSVRSCSQTRLECADLFARLPFLRSARPCARSSGACRPVLVGLPFLRPARSYAQSPEECRPVFAGLPVLVQFDLVCRSTEASFDLTHLDFQACCVMFQHDHQPVAPPQMIALRDVLHADEAQNLIEMIGTHSNG